ncbi:MAG: hypothetical protein PHI12_07435 [Dehalococcoidales bacterium]|nr:hypothetical protein [Dehalococcoidales bacterium]
MMPEVKELQIGHRYLLKEIHVDGDDIFEATVEEKTKEAPEEVLKLRRFPEGEFVWKESWRLQVVEELPN